MTVAVRMMGCDLVDAPRSLFSGSPPAAALTAPVTKAHSVTSAGAILVSECSPRVVSPIAMQSRCRPLREGVPQSAFMTVNLPQRTRDQLYTVHGAARC